MTYPVYVDSLQAETGRGLEFNRTEAAKRGLSKHGELLKRLKSD